MRKHILIYIYCVATALTAFAGEKDRVTVAVFSINDFHGAFVRDDAKDIPGAAAIFQTLDSLKKVYPYHITVSAGDNFGGSYFYNATRSRSLLPQFFKDLGIRLSAVGNHEFDDGQAALAAKWNDMEAKPSGWDIRYVCANVYDRNGATPAFVRPYEIEEVRISPDKKLRVAFVGLIAASTPQQVSKRRIEGLAFGGNYALVLDSLKRTSGYKDVEAADIRLLLTHVGTHMLHGSDQPAWDDKNADILRQLNDTSFHGILSSHTHQAVCGRLNEARYPIVQGKWHGNYISAITFTVDTVSMCIVGSKPMLFPVTPKARLEAGPRRLQAQIDELLETTCTQGGTPIGQRLTTAARTFIHDRDDKYRQTETGRLVCAAYAQAYRKASGTDSREIVVGCSHFGSIRSGFTAGPVRVLDVGEVLPFSNALKVYRLSGRQLRTLIEYGLHNRVFGWLQTADLDIQTDKAGHVKSIAYIVPGSPTRQVVPIKDGTSCILVADEFITNGGDGYDAAFFASLDELRVAGMPHTTDAFIEYLKLQPVLE